jgi:redox-sensitive bicupin YhaK (pirin superfamily)
MIAIRESNQRGHANHGWLDSHHTFSFAGYYDPRNMGFGALRVINEDRVSPGRGFGSHPHEDMEILTYVLSGALAHKDSMGNVETLRANELQRISAGTGIVHSEYNASSKEPVHFLQIWIEPDTAGLEPGYEQLALTEEQKLGKLVLVASPEGGSGALKIHQDARVLIGAVQGGKELGYEFQPGRNAWVHVVRGEAAVNGRTVSDGDAVALTGEPSLAIQGLAGSTEVVVFDLA